MNSDEVLDIMLIAVIALKMKRKMDGKFGSRIWLFLMTIFWQVKYMFT